MRNAFLFLLTVPLMAQAPAGEAQPGTQPAPAAAPAASNWISGSVEAGYRFISGVGGDFNTYRSVVNLGEGPKLFNADFTILPPNTKLVDRIDVHANSWGGDPYNTFRLDAKRQGLYDFTLDYRNIAYFNFLPSFANPGRINPSMPFMNEYGFDIKRRTLNTELDLFPGHRIIPFIAYSRNGGRGNGTTNFTFDNGEYTLPTQYSDHTNEARGGVRFEFNHWHATLEGGGLNFRDDQQVTQGSILPNVGNTGPTFLFQPVFFDGGGEAYGVRGGASFARGTFTANPVSWADISAQFLYSQPHSDVHYTGTATGNFFSFDSGAFFNTELLDATSSSRQPNPSADIGVVLRPFGNRFRIMESWSTLRMHTAGTTLLLDQMAVTGQAPTPTQLADATLFVVNYNRQELNLLYDVTRYLTVRAGHRYIWGDTTAPASLSIADAGLALTEHGVQRQNIALAGVTFRTASRFRATLDFEDSPGDRSYFRTSLNDYQRARIMGRWQVRPTLQFTARADLLRNQNPDPLIRYDFMSRDTTGTAYWNPSNWKGFSLLAEYSRSTVRSDIIYVIPNLPNADFTGLATDLSHYRENAHTGTLLADVPFLGGKPNRPKLSLGGSFFRSSGSRPARFWEPMARFSMPFGEHIQFNTEWRYYGLGQPYYLYENFRSNQFNLSVRFSM